MELMQIAGQIATVEAAQTDKKSKPSTKDEYVKWLKKEAKSKDGITWNEVKTKLKSLASQKGVNLSKKTLRKMKKGFMRLDKNKDGSINEKELRPLLKKYKL